MTGFRTGLTAAAGLVLVVPVWLFSPYRLGLAALILSFTVASLAQNFLSGYADIPSLGNVVFLATSSYSSAYLMQSAHVSFLLALPAGILSATLLGLLIGLPALRISGMHLSIVTVVMVFAAREIMQQWDAAHGQNGVGVSAPTWLLEARGTYLFSAVVSVIGYVLVANLLRSRSGRAILAAGASEVAAQSAGVNVTLYRLSAFMLSGALTGAAGIVYLYYSQTVTPGAFPLELSLAFLTMVIVGGSRSLAGAFLGAVIVGLIPTALAALPGSIGQLQLRDASPAVYAVLVLLCIRFFPDGIANAVSMAATRFKEPTRRA